MLTDIKEFNCTITDGSSKDNNETIRASENTLPLIVTRMYPNWIRLEYYAATKSEFYCVFKYAVIKRIK
jgi:hypothetical protein